MTLDYGQLALLFSRLLWPSGMVRERACDAAAHLLVDSEIGSVVTSKLLDWIADQGLESVAATGLLVLLRGKALEPELAMPSTEVVSASLRRPSLLSGMLMGELYGKVISGASLRECYTNSVPDDYQPDPFFVKYATGFLPPIYTDWADTISARQGIPFSRQWAYEWQHLVSATGAKKSDSPMHFHGQQHYDHYVIFDSFMSEVYRSAFLRALAWAADRSAIPLEEARYLAMKTCQLDLGLWLIDPITRPAWWPKASEPDGEIDTIAPQVWQQIQSLWDRQRDVFGDDVLIQASGRVYENKTVYDLELFGAFQRCEGGVSPEAEDVVKWYTDRPDLRYQASGMLFGGTVDQRDISSFAEEIEDWLVIPAARAVNPISIPRWDYWKEYRGIWIPLPYRNLEVSCSASGVSISGGDSEIAKWQIWTDGLREKQAGMLSSPASGEFVVARREVINGLAVELGCVFCWICRLIGHHRDYDGVEWKTFTNCRMFGTTGIVMPFT